MDEALKLNVALWSCCNFNSNDQMAEALLLSKHWLDSEFGQTDDLKVDIHSFAA